MEPVVRQAKVLIQIEDAEGVHEVGSTITFSLATNVQIAGYDRLVAQGVIKPVSPRSSRRAPTPPADAPPADAE